MRDFNPHRNLTLDRVLVTRGLRVWDYDLKPGTVVADEHDGDYGNESDHWFRVVRDPNPDGTGGGYRLFNGSRMWTRHPSTGKSPGPGPDMPEYGIVTPKPLACCGWQWDKEILNEAREGRVILDDTPTHLCNPPLSMREAREQVRRDPMAGIDLTRRLIPRLETY